MKVLYLSSQADLEEEEEEDDDVDDDEGDGGERKGPHCINNECTADILFTIYVITQAGDAR